MKRDYATGSSEAITYFTGVEIEKTPAYGLQTLFVVGVRPLEEITDIVTQRRCDHVYLGANQSFDGMDIEDWDQMTKGLLRLGLKVTLDFDSCYCQILFKWLASLNEFDNFIPQISLKIPNLTKYNNNATIKIDDIDFRASNDGVWCHRLDTLKTLETFTDWSQYTKDEIIK